MNDSGASVKCQICGDVGVGFHCGAHVCEACKKFFIRCLKLKCGDKFQCTSTGSCEINKLNRTKCPSCRYMKCLQLNMYGPGSRNVSKEISHMPCRVCGAPSSGFHFGAITCEGCKGFFRRFLWDKNIDSYRCIDYGSKNGECEITWKTRNACKYCRYKKCILVGMESNKSKIGRQSNLVKHKIHMALNEIKMAKGLPRNSIFPSIGTTIEISELSDAQNFDKQVEGERRCFKYKSITNSDVPYNVDHIDLSLVDSDISSLDSSDIQSIVSDFTLTTDQYHHNFNSCPQASHSSSQHSNFDDSFSCRQYDVCRNNYEGTNDGLIDYRSFIDQSSNPSYNESATYNHHHHDHHHHHRLSSHLIQDFKSKMSELPSLELIPHQSEDILRNPTQHDLIDIMIDNYKYLQSIPFGKNELLSITSSIESIWSHEMSQLARCTTLMLHFARNVPGFHSFCLEEKLFVIQRCLFPIASFLFAVRNEDDGLWFGFTRKDYRKMLEIFDIFKYFLPHFSDLTSYVRKISLDETEISFICASYIMDVGNRYDYKELFLDNLEAYIKSKHEATSHRHISVFKCINELKQISNIHQYVYKLFIDNHDYDGFIEPHSVMEAVLRRTLSNPVDDPVTDTSSSS